MKAIYTPFVQAADLHVSDATLRSRTLAAAVAVAVASTLALPTTEVDNIAAHYANTEQVAVARKVAEFNENVVFDVSVATDLVRALWMVRYHAAHPSAKPMFGSDCTFFEIFCGAHRYIDEDTCCFLNENKKPVLLLAGVACEILCATKGQPSGDLGDNMRFTAGVMGYGQTGNSRPF